MVVTGEYGLVLDLRSRAKREGLCRLEWGFFN